MFSQGLLLLSFDSPMEEITPPDDVKRNDLNRPFINLHTTSGPTCSNLITLIERLARIAPCTYSTNPACSVDQRENPRSQSGVKGSTEDQTGPGMKLPVRFSNNHKRITQFSARYCTEVIAEMNPIPMNDWVLPRRRSTAERSGKPKHGVKLQRQAV